MGILNIYVKSLVKSEKGFDEALQVCRGRLQTYFDRCLAKPDNRLFKSAHVSLHPRAKTVGEMDLLVYIVATRENTLMPEVIYSATAGGRTQRYPDENYSPVLSEIFAKSAMDDGKIVFGLFGADTARQGIALANLAFHELAHNKWHGMPAEEKAKYGVTEQMGKTHAVGGVMQSFEDGYGKHHISAENERVMAALVQHPVKQYTTPPRYPF